MGNFSELSAENVCRSELISDANHCVKSVRICSFSSSYFPAFGLNTERYVVSLCVLSECRKIPARKTPNTNTFYAVNGSLIPRN